jgi:hypothetical protein
MFGFEGSVGVTYAISVGVLSLVNPKMRMYKRRSKERFYGDIYRCPLAMS